MEGKSKILLKNKHIRNKRDDFGQEWSGTFSGRILVGNERICLAGGYW